MNLQDDIYDNEAEAQDDENTDGYEVEKILKRRFNSEKKVFEYYLKWKDYPHESNTWEPEESLNCPELLSEFLKKLEENARRAANTDVDDFIVYDNASDYNQDAPSTSAKKIGMHKKTKSRKRSLEKFKSLDAVQIDRKKKKNNSYRNVIISDDDDDDQELSKKEGLITNNVEELAPVELDYVINKEPKRLSFASSEVTYDSYGIPSELMYRIPSQEDNGFSKGLEVDYVYDLIKKPYESSPTVIIKFKNLGLGELIEYNVARTHASVALNDFYMRRIEAKFS